MASHGEGSGCAEVSSVLEGDKAEWDDDEENGLFVDVPPEEEGGVSAKRERANEGVPVGSEPELDQGELLAGSARYVLILDIEKKYEPIGR